MKVLHKPLFDPAILSEIKPLASRFALFCDESVADVLGKKWKEHLEKMGLSVALFTFPSGEQEKTRERKAGLEDLLFSHNFGKDSCIIAMGGGVTTDLIGFLASTFCRGVPLVLIPTTLLGMVDAAIGGKTGVNTRFGKNLIGSFYPASKILIDPSVLNTLPPEELTNGSAEIIKYALIDSPTLFEKLQTSTLDQIVKECIAIKMRVVEEDFKEEGLRRILNFGHTIGHAVERLENYRLSHGEAVAIGMLVESYLSVKMGHLSLQTFQEIEALVRAFPFPLQFSDAVTKEAMISALSHDKKAAKGAVRFVLLNKIGACEPFDGDYCTSVPAPLLNETLDWMIAQFSGGQQ